ncbi:MAG: glycosyltransferase family 39 protein [Candidatus Sumerlaeota bacterium]|nr:glycosyltransferase family 39 protein [Candidatus Sumerlaeota bacterium]
MVLPPLGLLWLFRRQMNPMLDWACSPNRRWALWAIGLAAIAFALYLGLFYFLFDGQLYMGDSQARLYHAQILSQGRWFLPAPAHTELYTGYATVVREGKVYSQYMPGAILLTLLGLKVGSIPIVFAMMGAACVWLTFAVGRRLYGSAPGLLGAALLMASPMFALNAVNGMDHVAAACLLMAAAWFGLRDLERPRLGDSLGLGFFLGYACIIRPLTVLGVAGPLLLIWAGIVLCDWRRRWPGWLIAFGGWMVPVGFLLLFNARTTGDPFLLAYRVCAPQLCTLGFNSINHHTPLDGLIYQFNNLHSLGAWMFLWPVASYLFIIIQLLGPQATRKDWIALGPLAGLVAAYFFYPYQDFFCTPRFLAESLPWLALLSARGILQVKDLLAAGLAPESRRGCSRMLAVGVLALFIAALPAVWQKYRYFKIDSTRGREFGAALQSFRSDPSVTVFFPAGSHDIQAMYYNCKCFGGAEFMIDPGSEKRRVYMRERPERRYFLLGFDKAGKWVSAPIEK